MWGTNFFLSFQAIILLEIFLHIVPSLRFQTCSVHVFDVPETWNMENTMVFCRVLGEVHCLTLHNLYQSLVSWCSWERWLYFNVPDSLHNTWVTGQWLNNEQSFSPGQRTVFLHYNIPNYSSLHSWCIGTGNADELSWRDFQTFKTKSLRM